MTSRILIIGFGNELMGDDGAGPTAARELSGQALAAGARVEDGGTDALTLPDWWRGEPDVWIIDAVRSGRPSGTIHRLDHDTILSLAPASSSCHHLSLPECLRWIAHAYPQMRAVRYRMWGIEAASVTPGAGLSAPVARAVVQVTVEVRAALAARSSGCD
jgi:hydrogenase maturation protease